MDRPDDPRVSITAEEGAVIGARQLDGRLDDHVGHGIDIDVWIGQGLHDLADRREMLACVGGRCRRCRCLLRARPHG